MVKRLILLALALLGLARPSLAQLDDDADIRYMRAKKIFTVPTASNVTGGWTFLHSTGAIGGSSSPEVQGCGTVTTSCTFITVATTAGSALAVGFELVDSQNVTITSAFSCVSSNPCLSVSLDKVDTFTLCAAAACHNNNANDDVDAAYVAGGSGGGATVITVNVSPSVTTSADAFFYSIELAPPTCGGILCTISLDGTPVTNHAASGCGSGCTGSNTLTLSATDGLITFLDTSNSVSNINSPYIVEQTGNIFSIDATSAPAFQITTAGYYTVSQLAFKSSGGSYTPTTPKFTAIGMAPPIVQTLNSNAVSCNNSCTVSANMVNSVSGDLIVIHAFNTAGRTITSITGRGGTWVVPTGAGTCQDTTLNAMSCGYTLSNTGGSGTITVTMSGLCSSCFFATTEYSKTGSTVLDAQGSGSAGSSTNVLAGPSLTITSTDVCIDQFTWTPNTSNQGGAYLYPQPGGSNLFGNFASTQAAVIMVLVNATTSTAPKTLLSANATSSESTGICFK